MLLKTKGKSYLIPLAIVAPVTRNPDSPDPGKKILISESTQDDQFTNFKAILSIHSFENRIDYPSVYEINDFDHLAEDDIVLVNTDGVINTLYRVQSSQNFLLITEQCNSNCLMCSQPPRDRDDSYLMDIYKELIPLIPKDCKELGLTGGEPTLLGEKFFQLLEQLKYELPETEIHCLTNGKSFALKNVTDRLGLIDYGRLMLGIPLYSDYYAQHDYIVQARNAFNETMQGFYNLASIGQRMEIRVVLHKQTIARLPKLAKFIYRNLPFVDHVAFMGLEYQGYTPHNIDKLWIDPVHYMNELGEAVHFLSSMGMNVSIYNSQLCLLPRDLWPFNRKSISDWKNIYLPQCNSCAMKQECGGLFQSSQKMHSEFLKPFEL